MAPIVPHQRVKNYNFLIGISSLFALGGAKLIALPRAENFPNDGIKFHFWLKSPSSLPK